MTLSGRFMLTLLFIFAAVHLFAQTGEENYKKILWEAAALVQQGSHDQADKLYRRAVKTSPAAREAYIAWADYKMLMRDWDGAKSPLKKLLKLYPEDIEGHYKMGICDRHDAFGKDIVRRRFLWSWSQEHFEIVIAADSSYKDVFSEYARLKKDQQEYEQAILLSHRQLRQNQQSAMAAYDIFTYYDLFLHHGGENALNPFADINEYQLTWLRKHNSAYDRYFIAEKYRRMGQFQKAQLLLSRLQNSGHSPIRIPILLSLTRLYYQTKRPRLAEEYFWRAVDAIRLPYEMHFIFDDIFFIMEDADSRVRFKDLADIRNFYRRFWNRKSPLAGMEYNARLAEHYRRLIKAEQEFTFHGERLSINNPERLEYITLPAILKRNKKFNDKGLVYIRYGEPDERAVLGGADVNLNESWLYYQNNKRDKLIFHFEIAKHAMPGDWRLVSVPTNRQMLETRLGWDKDLDKLYMARDAQDYTMLFNEIQNHSGKELSRAMSRDEHSWAEQISSIPLHISGAQFRAANGKNRFEVYLALPENSLIKETDSLRIGWTIFNKQWDKIGGHSLTKNISPADSGQLVCGQYIQPFHFESDLDLIYISAYVRDLDSTRMGGYRFGMQRTVFPQDDLSLSDIICAFSIQPLAPKTDRFYKHGLRIIPNPSQIFTRTKPLYLYFEIYNLGMRDSQSSYRIKQTVQRAAGSRGIFSRIASLFSGDSDKISITKEHQGASLVAYEYSAMDFSALAPGDYRIEITVEDLHTGQETSKQTNLRLK